MNKKNSFTLFLLAVAFTLAAQTTVPRYVFLEHVTNSRCSVCASRNPAMYNLIAQYPTEVHHLSYHPSFPYSNCIFYLANTTENNARAAYYGVNSTPKLILNGQLLPPTSQLLPAATLQTAISETSSIYVQVTEDATQVRVRIHTVGDKPTGDYKLYAAFAEKTVNYAAPNGEQVHHDVFRDMLTDINGEAIVLAETGSYVERVYSRPTNPNWNAAEMFTTAWVQNSLDKEVLNSGTRFDPLVSGVSDQPEPSLSFSPNPSSSVVTTSLGNEAARELIVYNISGQAVLQQTGLSGSLVQFDISTLQSGIYLVQIRGEIATFTGKFVKY